MFPHRADADAEAELPGKLEILTQPDLERTDGQRTMIVSVKYFVPCQDENNFAFECRAV